METVWCPSRPLKYINDGVLTSWVWLFKELFHCSWKRQWGQRWTWSDFLSFWRNPFRSFLLSSSFSHLTHLPLSGLYPTLPHLHCTLHAICHSVRLSLTLHIQSIIGLKILPGLTSLTSITKQPARAKSHPPFLAHYRSPTTVSSFCSRLPTVYSPTAVWVIMLLPWLKQPSNSFLLSFFNNSFIEILFT